MVVGGGSVKGNCLTLNPEWRRQERVVGTVAKWRATTLIKGAAAVQLQPLLPHENKAQSW